MRWWWGGWWLLREVELSTARAALVQVADLDKVGQATATLILPASKSDPMAFGSARTHRCRCRVAPEPGCPVHAVADQLLLLRRTFPSRCHPVFELDLPLFPTKDGGVVDKQDMASAICLAARELGVTPPADGSERVTGHSLRSTGAQGLLRLNWSPRAVQLMGRWASAAVEYYTRLAPLEAAMGGASSTLPEHERQSLIEEFKKLGLSQPRASEMAGDIIPLTSSPSSSTTSPTTWVLNPASGVHHIAQPDSSKALCGWRYTRVSHLRLPASEAPPPFPWAVCSSCAPAHRAALCV